MNFSELLVVLIVAMLVFNPKKLPELAKTLARLIRQVRLYSYAAKNEIHAIMTPVIQQAQLKENEERAEKAEQTHKKISTTDQENK